VNSTPFKVGAWIVLALILLGCASVIIDRSRSPQQLLDAKIVQVSTLTSDLQQKRVQIKQTHEKFVAGAHELEREILAITASAKIASSRDAVENPRIVLDLRLIEGKSRYIAELDRMDAASIRGIEDLTFTKREAEDKRLMSTVVDSAQAQELIDRIDTMLKRYRNESASIDPAGAQAAQDASPQDVQALQKRWDDLVASRGVTTVR
jgi:outer membrane murein-binding lipoprotein Lpp